MVGGIIFPFGKFFQRNFFLLFSRARVFLFWIISKETIPLWIIGTYFACMHPESSTAYKFYEGLIRVSSNYVIEETCLLDIS